MGQLDSGGSAVGAARMNPSEAFDAVPRLLKEFIDTNSQEAWTEIKRRIDNVFVTVSTALESLEAAAPFSQEIQEQVSSGRKLFFKPNLVTLPLIDYRTHGPSSIGSCTPWEFTAAVMRWFHDNLDISYHMMSLGEGGTNASLAAAAATKLMGGEKITTLALFEGKCGDVYGGWGFYFARKYLADTHDNSHTDDPMKGYHESLEGVCLPPGKVSDKLLLYDINKVSSDGSNGREVPVANGVNFKSITLHKAVVGGDPNDPADIRNWPGCVLINVPKLKIHQLELLTCAVKNLGVGLYPMESNSSTNPGEIKWRYALPDVPLPSFKVKLPHRRWELAFDEKTGFPVRDGNGGHVMNRTGGMEATMADGLQAVQGQGVLMLHIADGIETCNIAHTGPNCTPVPEGFVFTATDPVALDELALHYLFNTVPMDQIEKTRRENKLLSDVIQKIPLPEIDGGNIVTGEGFDSPYSRYHALQYCQERGLGRREFHVVGKDLWHGGELASLGNKLGRVEKNVFTELISETMYYTEASILWYLQAASVAFLKADDHLTNSSYKQKILDAYDEDNNGIIDFLEKGKNSLYGVMPYGAQLAALDIEPEKVMRHRFLLGCAPIRLLKAQWNPDGHSIGEDDLITNSISLSFIMSKAGKESPDPFFPGRSWGKGKWPSLQFAIHRQLCRLIYGPQFPERFDYAMSPYGQAFRYADTRWNDSQYCSLENENKSENIIGLYHEELVKGARLLPFVFFVPEGFASIYGKQIPNVKESSDPDLIFTASFNGEELWRDLDLTDIC